MSYRAVKQRSMWLKHLQLFIVGVTLPLVTAVAVEPVKDPVLAHLESLGYECDVMDQGIRARHVSKIPFVVSYSRGGILLQTGFPGKSESPDVLKRFVILNAVNARMLLARGFWTDDGNLFVKAWLPGLYDKVRFTGYVDAWERDMQTLREAGPTLQPFLTDGSQ
jgi:hypothetical protein